MADFLLEIGTEEIPDWMIEPALQSLRDDFLFAAQELQAKIDCVDATPRRLAIVARDLDERRADLRDIHWGPYLSVGPKAAEGFARKWGVEVNDLEIAEDAKGQRYRYAEIKRGRSAIDLLSERLPVTVQHLRWPKTMCWTGKGGMRFIRPIRWIVALLGDQIVPFKVAGVQSGNTTRGHRILGSKLPLQVTVATYLDVLRDDFVIVRAEERRQRIQAGLGPGVHKDDDLLRTLVYLTEFPTPIRGSFDSGFLELPQEILSTVMRHHQRYFSVVKEDGSLAPEFVAITNTDGDPDGLIRQGNERVLRARFNDARFFWTVDRQKKLSDRVADLAKITFQAKLGSYKDKAKRITYTAGDLARDAGADELTAKHASELCKCDLTTDMVKEFPELQGVVGGLYAKQEGEPEAVWVAIYDHYKPVSTDDSIPRTLEGQIVSLADKLDTLRECFKIGLIPTGSKDPFALRRAAQGIVRILFEARLRLDLNDLFAATPELYAFIEERITFYLREVLNYAYDEIKAAIMSGAGITTLADLADRVQAIHQIRATEDFEPVAASFKRIKNIIRQADLRDFQNAPAQGLLVSGPERRLYEEAAAVKSRLPEMTDYEAKLAAIASLRPHIDLFFDKILVNDPDLAIRQNRYSLLMSLLTEFSNIADFSEIVTQGASGA